MLILRYTLLVVSIMLVDNIRAYGRPIFFWRAIILIFITALRGMKKYNFNFTGVDI